MFLNDYLASKQSADDASTPSRDSRLSRRLAVGMDGSVSGQEESMDRSFASSIQDSYLGEEEGEEAILVLNDDEYSWNYQKSRRNKKRCILCTALVLCVAAIIIGVTVPLVTKKDSADQLIPMFSGMFSGPMTQLEACQAGFFQDTKEPHLEIHMRGITQELTSPESIAMLETAIAVGYNEASGGCADIYHRVMYDAKLQGQQVVRDLVLSEQDAESLETLFAETTVMIAQFHTKVACDGCPPDEGFASVYPATYRGSRKKRRALEGDSSFSLNDSLEFVPIFRNLESALDAGEVIKAIEKSVRNVLLDLEGFQEVTILTKEADGSSAATTLYEQTDSNDAYKPSFFRNKAIKDAQQFRDCEMAVKKRKKSNKASGSSSKSAKSAKSSPSTSAPSSSAPSGRPPRTPAPTGPVSTTSKGSKSSKGPTMKSSKGPTMKSSKGPTMKSSKGPTMKSSKGPTMKSSKTCDDVSNNAVGITSTHSSKSSKGPTMKSSKGPTMKSSKGPTMKSSKGPTMKSSKGPTMKSSKGPTMKSSKGPTMKSSKGPTMKSSKGPTMKSQKSATSATAAPSGTSGPAATTVNKEVIGDHPSCLVCGSGKIVTNQAGTFVPPGQRETQCRALELAGINGFIPADSCPMIPALISGPCGCA